MAKKLGGLGKGLSAIFIALGVVGSMFSFPVLGAKCAPVQHIINVLSGIILGPFHALLIAFLTSLLRNLLGLGSLLAFPGSMIGAFCCGICCKMVLLKSKNQSYALLSAAFGEVFGTGILGAICAYPIAVLCGINPNAAIFTFVVPFLISTVIGSISAVFFVAALRSTGIITRFQERCKY